MYNVKLYNKISKVGLDDLDAAKYTCSEDFTDYDAVLVRSAKLHEVEQKNDMNLDAAANLSGEMLGELYVWKKDVYERDLRELGFYLGKFIYLCDSFEDVEQDIKKNNYNPLAGRFKRPEFEDESRMMLEDMMARACRAFECLPLIEDAPIMRNILYSGIWLRFESACERRKAKSKQ